jgi:drug/metabolite transporter (DMT)-like permease
VRGGRAAGGALLAGAMTLFNLGDTFVKLLAERLPVAQVICARNLAAGAILLAAWAWRRDLASGRDLLDRHVLARAALDTATTLLYLQGVALLPLAEAAALLFASPLVATALAGPLLGERVDGARWLAVGAGFAGVLLVVQPGAVDWRPATLLPLAAAFVMAASDLVTRRIRPEVGAAAVVATNLFAVAAAAAAWAALAGPRPLGAADAAPLAAAAAFLLAGYLCYVAAFRLAEVSFVAPFKYGGLPAAALLGWLVWGHVPNATSVLGGAVIVACGLFLLAREGRAEPRAA